MKYFPNIDRTKLEILTYINELQKRLSKLINPSSINETNNEQIKHMRVVMIILNYNQFMLTISKKVLWMFQ
jgi:hypothetical protein